MNERGGKRSVSKKEQAHQVCPFCGSDNVALIQWGRPMWNDELERKLKDGEIVLGGCMISPDSEKWECNNCGKRFGLADFVDVDFVRQLRPLLERR